MNKNTYREIDIKELETLSIVGGDDNGPSIQPMSSPMCFSATLTLISFFATITSPAWQNTQDTCTQIYC